MRSVPWKYLNIGYANADCKGAEESGSVADKEDCLRTCFLQDHPEMLQRFTSDLLPLLLQVYGSTVVDKVT